MVVFEMPPRRIAGRKIQLQPVAGTAWAFDYEPFRPLAGSHDRHHVPRQLLRKLGLALEPNKFV